MSDEADPPEVDDATGDAGAGAVDEGRTAAALADRDDVYTRQFGRLEAHLLPNGTPQERLVSPFSFFLKFGVRATMDLLLTLPAEGALELRI